MILYIKHHCASTYVLTPLFPHICHSSGLKWRIRTHCIIWLKCIRIWSSMRELDSTVTVHYRDSWSTSSLCRSSGPLMQPHCHSTTSLRYNVYNVCSTTSFSFLRIELLDCRYRSKKMLNLIRILEIGSGHP